MACPWLIARFVDREAEFRFAPADEVAERAAALGATPFDVAGARLTHRSDRCSFDALLDDYQFSDPTLRDLAEIVRAADTDRLDLAPQAAGLLAISLGLSRLCLDDDHRMLARGFVVYDALYEWLRHGRDERHGWNPGGAGGGEPAWTTLRGDGFEIDLGARRVTVVRRKARPRPKRFTLLVTPVARSGRVLSRGFLLQPVWAYAPDVTSRTVDWHVAPLRKELGPVAWRLETVRGAGYRWIEGLPKAPRNKQGPSATSRGVVAEQSRQSQTADGGRWADCVVTRAQSYVPANWCFWRDR